MTAISSEPSNQNETSSFPLAQIKGLKALGIPISVILAPGDDDNNELTELLSNLDSEKLLKIHNQETSDFKPSVYFLCRKLDEEKYQHQIETLSEILEPRKIEIPDGPTVTILPNLVIQKFKVLQVLKEIDYEDLTVMANESDHSSYLNFQIVFTLLKICKQVDEFRSLEQDESLKEHQLKGRREALKFLIDNNEKDVLLMVVRNLQQEAERSSICETINSLIGQQ